MIDRMRKYVYWILRRNDRKKVKKLSIIGTDKRKHSKLLFFQPLIKRGIQMKDITTRIKNINQTRVNGGGRGELYRPINRYSVRFLNKLFKVKVSVNMKNATSDEFASDASIQITPGTDNIGIVAEQLIRNDILAMLNKYKADLLYDANINLSFNIDTNNQKIKNIGYNVRVKSDCHKKFFECLRVDLVEILEKVDPSEKSSDWHFQ